MNRLGTLLGAFVVVVLLVVAGALVLRQAETSKADLPVYGEVPQFTFTNQDGEPFGREDLIGKVSIVDFIFTRCQTACPIMAREMGELYKAFSGTDELQFVSVSVDPAHDTLAVLQAYAKANGVTDERWQFLHAPIDSVVWLSEQGFMLAADKLPMGHSTKFALVDRSGRIRGYFNALEEKPMAVIRDQIVTLLEEPWSPEEAAPESAARRGQPQEQLAGR